MEEKEYRNCYECIDDFKKDALVNENLGLLPSSYPTLNNVLGGGFKFGLILLGAIPSLGKTSFFIKESITWARNDYKVLFFSFEMSKEEIMAKMLNYNCYEMCVDEKSPYYDDEFKNISYNYTDFMFNKVDKKVFTKLIDMFVYAKNIIVFERNDDIEDIEKLKNIIINYKKKNKKVVVIIDYIQIIVNASLKNDSLKNALDMYVSELRNFSNNKKIPIFAISSFSRNNMYNTANMDSFKESGGMEYGADYLLALEPQNFKDNNTYGNVVNENKKELKKLLSNEIRDLNLVLLKGRNSIGYKSINIRFNAKYNEFTEK